MLLNKSRSKGTVMKYNFHHFVGGKVQACLTKQPIDDSAILECNTYGKDKILNDFVKNTPKRFNKTASSVFFGKMEPKSLEVDIKGASGFPSGTNNQSPPRRLDTPNQTQYQDSAARTIKSRKTANTTQDPNQDPDRHKIRYPF